MSLAKDEIKALMRLRKLNLKTVASDAGISCYTLSKTINGTPVKQKNGHISFYQSPKSKQAIATALNLPVESVWGPNAKQILEAIIHNEIAARLTRVDGDGKRCAITLSVRKRYMPKWSLRLFLRNLINLGRK